MLLRDEAKKTVTLANEKMRFAFSYADGLKLTGIIHENSELNWLDKNTEAFELTILGSKILASSFIVDTVTTVNDGAQEYAIFELSLEKPYKLKARVSAYTAFDSSIYLLAQLAPYWENEWPEEIFLHIPMFKNFGYQNNKWYLSSCPVKRPDGTSVMQLHDSFDLPICNVSSDQKTGFSIELRDIDSFGYGWNQLRNCDLLHATEKEQLINNKILLRLQNRTLTDVFEFRFFALDEGWPEAFSGWKKRVTEEMNFQEYEREDLQWYKKDLYQFFSFAYSKEVFNYETNEFEPERLIESGKEFGGFDSVILWYVYPRLGVDSRDQWEFSKDIPDGFAGLKDFVQRCHKLGVKVFLPFNPWDVKADEEKKDTLENIVELIRESDIDGIWFDTMDHVPAGFRERIDEIKPGFVFCLENNPESKKTIEKTTGHWDQFLHENIMPRCDLLRYLFPQNNAPAAARWSIGENKDTFIKSAIFNGSGLAIWQDVFGAWLPFSTEQKASLKKWKGILLDKYDTFFGKNPVPMMPVEQEGLYANRFVSDDGKNIIYTVYNAVEKPIEGALIRVENAVSCKEIWHNSPVTAEGNILKGRIDPGDIIVVSLSV